MDAKDSLRKKIWALMEEENIASFPRPVHHRIPNFVGASEAADRLTQHSIFINANVVKVNPDAPQIPVRRQVLFKGKILIMPTPRLRAGFLFVDPSKTPKSCVKYASTIKGAFQYGKTLDVFDIPKVDLVIAGSVAVSRDGSRIGKGGGYSEMEYGILRSLNVIGENTPVATTVHEIQIVNDIPMCEHDLSVNYIVTPKKIIETIPKRKNPSGIYWNKIPSIKLYEMPILKRIKELNR